MFTQASNDQCQPKQRGSCRKYNPMKYFTKHLLLLALSVLGVKAIGQNFNGFALYNSLNSNTAYLIDENGDVAHTWSCDEACNYAVMLKENGNIVRGAVYDNNSLNGAAVGGMIQELDANANIVWEYVYSSSSYVSHHDITIMPNGNVMLIAWEVKTSNELEQAGSSDPDERWPTHFIELEPDGNGGASIVWEWHIWDHLIQDHDATKDNYGVVADHPELIDMNLLNNTGGGGGPGGGGPGGGGGDWFHVNGIDYNEDLDQIAFSSRYLSEIFIIDHSTTTAEAAGHTGGNSGMGGDILYRWGNPSNYGASGTQVIPAAVHDVRWIPNDGRRNAGYLQFFNNEGGSGNSSTVDAIETPVNGYTYTYTQGQAYGPSTYTYRHECEDDADGQSAADMLSNGNLFVNLSQSYMYEVDSLDNVIWQYNAGPAKAFRYECDHPGIIALMGTNPCGIIDNVEEISVDQVHLFPNPSTGEFNVGGLYLSQRDVEITVMDLYGNVVLQTTNTDVINLSEQANGVYLISFLFEGGQVATRKVSLIR